MMCAEIRDKLVDFLYDELPAGTRDAIAEHLDGCPSCKAEMASFRRTLGDARAALHGPLLEEPPMRVRLAVLQAAEAAKRGVAASPREAKAPPRDGFFTRLFRAPWFLPAFGAASVATVVFLVRVLKDPEVVPGQTPHALEERNVVAPKAAPAVVPAPTAPPREDDTASQPAAETDAVKPAAMPAKIRRPAVSLGSAGAARGDAREERALGMLGGKGRGTGSGPRADAPAAFAEPPAQASRAKASKDLDNLLGETSERRFAAPPPPRPASAVAAPRTMKKKASAEPLDGFASGTAREEASAPAPAAAVAPAPAAAPSGAAASHKQEADREEAPTLEERVRKADRLYANQDWNTAAEAYRDLLRRYPRNKDLARWRERADAATTAYQRTLEAKGKKARVNDTLDGLKY